MNDSSSTVVEACVRDHKFSVLQRPTSLDHGLALWDSALGFAKYYEYNPKVLEALGGPAARILEVGAGCGLVAMVAAQLSGAAVLATDLPVVIENLERCVQANSIKLVKPPAAVAAAAPKDAAAASAGAPVLEPGAVTAMPYSWGDCLQRVLGYGPFDAVIGTDVLYSKALVAPLLKSIARVCYASAHGLCGGSSSGCGSTGGSGSGDGGPTAATCVCCSACASTAPLPAAGTAATGDALAGVDGAPAPLALLPSAIASSSSAAASVAGTRKSRTVVYLANEVRCTDTHAHFLACAEELFAFKEIPSKRLGPALAGSGVKIYELRLKADAAPPFPLAACGESAASPAAAGGSGSA